MAERKEESFQEQQGGDVRKGKRKETEIGHGDADGGTSRGRGRPRQGLTEEEKRELKKNSDRNYRKNRTDKLKRLENQEEEMMATVKGASEMVQTLKDEMKAMKETYAEEKKNMEATIKGLQYELARIKSMNQQIGKEGNDIPWEELGDIVPISPLSTDLEENHEEAAKDDPRSASWSEEFLGRILGNKERNGGVQGSTASTSATTRASEEIESLQKQMAKQNEEMQALKTQMSKLMLLINKP